MRRFGWAAAAVALRAGMAWGYGAPLPFEHDFSRAPIPYVQLRGTSAVAEDAAAGGKAVVNGKDYDVLGVFLHLGGELDRPIVLTVSAAAGAGERSARLGVIGLMVKDGKALPDTAMTFGWDRMLQRGIYTDETFTLRVPEKQRERGTDLYVALYRCNRQGVLKIGRIACELGSAGAGTKKAAGAEPRTVRTAPVYPAGTGDALKLDFFPLGVYTSGSPSHFEEAARAESAGVWTIADRLYGEVRDLGANSVYFGAHLEQDGAPPAAQAARIAASHGLKVIVQPNDVYFRGNYAGVIGQAGYKDSAGYFAGYTAPRVKRYLPEYKGNADIWAWSPVEELHGDPKLAEEMAAYRRLIWDISPGHLIYELHSDLNMMKRSVAPHPNVMGIDRYCFVNAPYGENRMMWTPNMALRWLRTAIRPFIDEAAALGRPCVFVMQGNAGYQLVDPSAYPFLKTAEEKKAYTSPLIPDLRYYPEIDRFGRWGFFYPAKHAMRAMCWIGVLEGAKGLMVWSYGYDHKGRITRLSDEAIRAAMEKKRMYVSMGGIRRTTKAREDLKRGFAEVAPFGKLLLGLAKDPGATVKADNPAIWTGAFKDGAGNRFAVVMNSRIATWDGDSPEMLDYPHTKLTVDDEGNQANYETAAPISFGFTAEMGKAKAGVYALTPAVAVAAGEKGTWRMTLEPGQGTVVYIGDRKKLDGIKRAAGL